VSASSFDLGQGAWPGNRGARAQNRFPRKKKKKKIIGCIIRDAIAALPWAARGLRRALAIPKCPVVRHIWHPPKASELD